MASAAARLLRAYATQVEALRRLRHGGSCIVGAPARRSGEPPGRDLPQRNRLGRVMTGNDSSKNRTACGIGRVETRLAPATQRRFLATHKRPDVIFCRMTRSECLKRSVECCRLAESVIEPEMKVYLLRLALSWMQAATSADERARE